MPNEEAGKATTKEDAFKAQTDVLNKEVEYRRKTQWDIFSWCSTILAAIIGGIIALATKEKPRGFLLWQKWLISVSSGVLALYAWRWINYNWKCERGIARELRELIKLSLSQEYPPRVIGYPLVLALLFLGVLVATWSKWT
jgi:hypothetical protein